MVTMARHEAEIMILDGLLSWLTSRKPPLGVPTFPLLCLVRVSCLTWPLLASHLPLPLLIFAPCFKPADEGLRLRLP
jgi:hypothetical protein